MKYVLREENMKRSIKTAGYILAVLIVSTLITAGVYAYSFIDVAKYQDAVETLNSIGVIKGRTDMLFSPDEDVTRWQMALMMTKMMTGNIDNDFWVSSSEAAAFPDVVNNIRHYGGSIAYAVKHEIIIGRPDGNFGPEDGITLQDAATIMVRALGYPRSQYDAGYPDSYIEKANSLGLFNGLTAIYPTETLTRGETAQILYNAFTAPKRIGNTIAEDIFGYSDALVVLAATPQMRLSTRVTLAAPGKLVFCELKPDGTLNASAAFSMEDDEFYLDNPNDALGKSYRVTSVLGYDQILSINECDSEILTQNMVSDLLTVPTETGKSIKLGNISYEVVSKYSYRLEEGITPQSRQMIVYGAAEMYETTAVLSASDIYGTNTYYKLTTYDDNSDGYPDRALYRPYSFARYTKNGNDIKLEGAATIDLKANAVKLTGMTVTAGDYVVYSYVPDASEIDILKVMTVNTGTVTEYTEDTIRIKPVTSTAAGTEYYLGNNNLRGSYRETIRKIFAANPAVSYVGSNIKYISDGLYVLMIDITSQDTGTLEGYVSQKNCAVVKNVDITNAGSGTISLSVYLMDGTTGLLTVNAINNNYINYTNMSSIAVGDIVEYALLGSYYSIVNITSKPFVSTGSNNSNFYYLTADTVNIGLGYKTVETQTVITPYGTLRMSPDIRIIFYNGYTFEDITYDMYGKVNYMQQILPNYSMYASYGAVGSSAKFVYVRFKYIPPAATPGTTEHTKILYIDAASILARQQESGTLYYNAFDFMANKYVYAEYVMTLTDQYGSIPQIPGYYKASLNISNDNRYMLKEPNPVSADTANANIVLDLGTTLGARSISGSTYTLTLGDKIYTTAALSIFETNSQGLIVQKNVSDYFTNNTLRIVDVFMKPANAANSSAQIALLIK